jgi:glycine cleavage system H protein
MPLPESKKIFFKRSNFVTHLPAGYLYSPSHYWLSRQPDGHWRVGFTKFAVRMLGELVDQGFEAKPEQPIKPGDVLGWIEGFKAVTDVFGVINGAFQAENMALKEHLDKVYSAPYDAGWLYEASGDPDSVCVDVKGYVEQLNQTIDRMLEQQDDHAED